MQTLVISPLRPDQNIYGNARSPKHLVSQTTLSSFFGGMIGHDDQNIAITVRSRFTSCNGSKKINPLGFVRVNQPVYDISQFGILSEVFHGQYPPVKASIIRIDLVFSKRISFWFGV